MILIRSKIRNACFHMKLGIQPEDGDSVKMVEAVMEPHHIWEGFNKDWDIAISNNEVVIIKLEGNVQFVFDTCTAAKMAAENNLTIPWSARQKNVIDIIQADWLEPMMNWKNYGTVWAVHTDPALKRISTRLLNKETGQREISKEELVPEVSTPAELNGIQEVSVDLASAGVKRLQPEEITKINASLGKLG